MKGKLKARVIEAVWEKFSVKNRLNTQPGVKKRTTKSAAGMSRYNNPCLNSLKISNLVFILEKLGDKTWVIETRDAMIVRIIFCASP